MNATALLTPNAERLINALSHIGYSIEDSLSDLIDNSLTAGSTGVLVRFVHDGDSLQQVLVADDGSGMSASELREAMRFGSRKSVDPASLGKFGLGLKLASLGYSDELTVASRKSGRAVGMRWTVKNIARGWVCEKLSAEQAKSLLDSRFATLNLSQSGTVICWSSLKNMPSHKRGIRSVIGLIERKLRLHFGLRFHRFIERGFKLAMDQQRLNEPVSPYWVEIDPLDPFAYSESGSRGYPKVFHCADVAGEKMRFEAHIWPPNSTDENYRLGRRASSHQGFYVYRKDRLIQAGGWFGVVNDEKEPHSSLARIKLDLPEPLEDLFALNVQKSSVIPPIGFQDSLLDAIADDGTPWESFRSDAIAAYRVHGGSKEEFPRYVLGRGFDKGVKPRNNHDSLPLSLKWSRTENAPLVALEQQALIFNRALRSPVSTGSEKVLLNAIAVLVVESLNDSRTKLAKGDCQNSLSEPVRQLFEELLNSLTQS